MLRRWHHSSLGHAAAARRKECLVRGGGPWRAMAGGRGCLGRRAAASYVARRPDGRNAQYLRRGQGGPHRCDKLTKPGKARLAINPAPPSPRRLNSVSWALRPARQGKGPSAGGASTAAARPPDAPSGPEGGAEATNPSTIFRVYNSGPTRRAARSSRPLGAYRSERVAYNPLRRGARPLLVEAGAGRGRSEHGPAPLEER